MLSQAGVPTILVTHDFDETAAIASALAVLGGGGIIQRGTPGELAARPTSAFVVDLIGSVVLTGEARWRVGGLVEIALDGGGKVLSTDRDRTGRMAVSVHPWEITLAPPASREPPPRLASGSQRASRRSQLSATASGSASMRARRWSPR